MNKIKIWDKDNNQLLFILIISVLLIYFVNPQLAKIGYLLFIPWAYKSKRSYIWLAFLFILFDTPNYFYVGGTVDDPTRVPIYSISKGLSFTFQDLLIFVLFFKSYKKQIGLIKFFQNELIGFSIVFLLSSIVALTLGVSFSNISLTIRSLLPLLLIFIIPKILTTKEDWLNFLKLIFPIVIFTFIGQVYFIITFKPLATLVSPGLIEKLNLNFVGYTEGFGPSRFYTGVFIGFISYCAGLYFLTQGKLRYSKFYLLLIVFLSAVQPILSATRAYTIAFLLIFIIWFFTLKAKQYPRIILILSVLAVTITVYIGSSLTVTEQVSKSLERFNTLTNFIEGDMTAGGSYGRLSVRTPRVWNKFIDSPMLGYGFSDDFFEYADEHVSLPNTLLNNGIIGFIIFYIALFSLFIKIIKSKRTKKRTTESVLFIAGLLGILMIHLLGRQLFGLLLPAYISFFVIVYLNMWYFFIKNPIDSVQIN